MSSFPILDLVVGVIFIFFLLSIICSAAVELWFSMLNTRASILEKWLKQIFNAQALDSNGIPKLQNGNPVSVGQEIMDHCMVTALSKTGKSGSYIDAENFVSALLDKITITPASPGVNTVQLPPKDMSGYIEAIEKSGVISGELKRTILSFAYQAKAAGALLTEIPQAAAIKANISSNIKSDIDQFRDRLENWYDTNSNRLTGTFKRKKVFPATIIAAIIITVGLNADTIDIGSYLYDHQEQAKEFADKSLNSLNNYQDRVNTIKNSKNDSTVIAIASLDSNFNYVKNDINNLKSSVPQDLPLGWSNGEAFSWKKVMGWLATVLAISMGAPFWFDILNKIANLRGAGPKPVVNDDNNTK